MLRGRQAPTEVSRGQPGTSIRQPWSSVRCSCSTLSLWNAIRSMNRSTSATGMKWRATSSSTPRQANRGSSRTR